MEKMKTIKGVSKSPFSHPPIHPPTHTPPHSSSFQPPRSPLSNPPTHPPTHLFKKDFSNGKAPGLDNLLYSADAEFSCFADLALTSPAEYYKEG